MKTEITLVEKVKEGIIELGGRETITSLEVAEKLDKQHKNVMRDIRNILKDLDKLDISYKPYFEESFYKNKQNKEQPMYVLTKKGFELYGNRMTGSKGTLFAVNYIEKAHQLHERLTKKDVQEPKTQSEMLRDLIDRERKKEQLQQSQTRYLI